MSSGDPAPPAPEGEGMGRLEAVKAAEQARYRPLIDGAARIGVILGSTGLPWEAVTPFVTRFSGDLADYLELSLDDAAPRLGVMTQGSGQHFVHRVARFMEEQGVAEARLRRFLATARHFGHRATLFKVSVGPEGVEELGWYLRVRPELGVGLAWLREAGVADVDLALCTQISGALKKRSLHFLAASERVKGTGPRSRDKVYWSQGESGTSWPRLAEAARLAGVDPVTWGRLDEHMVDIAGKQSFLSVGFAGGERLRGAKLDLAEVRGEVMLRIAAAEAPGERALERLRLLAGLSRSGVLDFVGLRLRPGLPISTRGYLCRWG